MTDSLKDLLDDFDSKVGSTNNNNDNSQIEEINEPENLPIHDDTVRVDLENIDKETVLSNQEESVVPQETEQLGILDQLESISVEPEQTEIPVQEETTVQTKNNENASSIEESTGDNNILDSTDNNKKTKKIVMISLITSLSILLISAIVFFLVIFPLIHTKYEITSETPEIQPIKPINESKLVRSIPLTDLNLAMITQKATKVFSNISPKPTEEYTMTYSQTGDTKGLNFEVIVAWFQDSNAALSAFASLQAGFGQSIFDTTVTAQNQVTGLMKIFPDTANQDNGIALWQNSSVIVQVKGPKDQLEKFYHGYAL